MEIIYDAQGFDKKNVVALGDFDGVHTGHRQLIEKAVSLARERDEFSLVYTFDQSFKKVNKITVNSEKQELLMLMGVDCIFLQKTDQEFLKTSPEDFVVNVIKNKLNASVVVIGKHYTFGYKGLGKSDDLIRLCKENGVETIVMPLVEIDDFVVSSTHIRFLIEYGEMKKANKLLGRNFSVTGLVEEGNHIGRNMGFPTINIPFEGEKLVPRYGVYFVYAYINENKYQGIANVGVKPTVGASKPLAEVNIFDFENYELYGEKVKIEFLYFLRQEQEFSSIEMLKEQISKDMDMAKEFFASYEEV